MSDTLLILVRHGQTHWNVAHRFQGQQDSDLTTLGQSQAAQVARALQRFQPTRFFASDLGRAQATATIISQTLGLPASPDPRWRERNFGELEGLSIADLEPRFGPDLRHRMGAEPDFAAHRIESLDALDARVHDALDDIAAHQQGQTTLVVTHGGPLLAAARIALGLPHSRPRVLSIENCTINVFKLHDSRWRIETWGAQPI